MARCFKSPRFSEIDEEVAAIGIICAIPIVDFGSGGLKSRGIALTNRVGAVIAQLERETSSSTR